MKRGRHYPPEAVCAPLERQRLCRREAGARRGSLASPPCLLRGNEQPATAVRGGAARTSLRAFEPFPPIMCGRSLQRATGGHPPDRRTFQIRSRWGHQGEAALVFHVTTHRARRGRARRASPDWSALPGRVSRTSPSLLRDVDGPRRVPFVNVHCEGIDHPHCAGQSRRRTGMRRVDGGPVRRRYGIGGTA